ncbi:hypothetical protein BD626DRAFT_504269 [Schizophyllum amplum]|uniref:RGS domain-containing protein n=1 Tax=Schizophyllum amplum TaxID=97359 RepID=A0A550C6U5_9AGAR|nr:hypothetical protein BD626DRAFT_504269 [Auriculariopsis ampla]
MRSFGVTPVFRIRLEDVLNRKHFPPLGLKDFEEWLLYVEKTPENLYFTLWLREYTVYYQHWLAQAKSNTFTSASSMTDQWLPTSPPLSMFYLRAKQTFLTPDADFELNVPSDLLAPFHDLSTSPYPEPAAFAPLAIHVRGMLEDSLRRFVEAQFTNVGNRRAYCGIVAGAIFTLVGGIFPLLFNLFVHNTRWLRLTAIPGMWLGLIVFLSALNGVCVGVYVFGDLRQLHKFELARPPISRPKPLAVQRNLISQPLAKISALQSSVNVLPSSPTPPRPSTSSVHSGSSTYTSSSDISATSGSSEDSEEEPPFIQISPAYHDDDPVSASSPPDFDPPVDSPLSAAETFVPTAAFIHAFDTISDFECTLEEGGVADIHQPMSPFDFDALPPRIHPLPQPSASSRCGAELDFVLAPPPPLHVVGRSRWAPWLSRGQAVCVPANQWTNGKPPTMTGYSSPSTATYSSSPTATYSSPTTATYSKRSMLNSPQSPAWEVEVEKREESRGDQENASDTEDINEKGNRSGAAKEGAETKGPANTSKTDTKRPTDIRKGFNIVHAVPAFGVPLTPVRSPVIVRAQWEIVVRSAILGFLICWVVVGPLLAVPGTPLKR